LAPPVLRVGPLTSTRDFVSVSDAAAGVVALADRGEPGIYNVASGLELPVKAVVDGILRAGGVEGDVTVEELPGRPADLPRSYADVSRLRSLGWEPKQDIDAAIRELLDLYLFQLAPPGVSGRSST
jgi:nucleoside-diphosphate-sugar epimerase